MRVAHVHRIRGIGGSERHLLTLLPALADRGIEPVLVGLDDPDWNASDFYDALQVPAVRLRSAHDVDPLLLARLLRSLRADVVHTHLVHADLYGGLAAKLRGAALVSTKHNDDPFRSGPFRFVERGLVKLADRVVTITDALRHFAIEQVGVEAGKVQTIHYGLDDLPFAWGENSPDDVPAARASSSRPRASPSRRASTSRSARSRTSGRRRARRARRRARTPAPDAARRRARRRAACLPRRAAAGRCSWLNRATVYVQPSRWEGFGLGVLEAMLASLPVVASSVSSLPELVSDGETGLLVPPDDAETLAHALAAALARPELGANGRERARREFSVARMADATLALYRTL